MVLPPAPTPLLGDAGVSVLFVVAMGLALDIFVVGECAGPREPVRGQCVSMGGVTGDHTGADAYNCAKGRQRGGDRGRVVGTSALDILLSL